jgi:callose synthase
MVREMDGMLRQQIAEPAKSCDSNSENGVSFLDQVITPLYGVIAAVSAHVCHFFP